MRCTDQQHLSLIFNYFSAYETILESSFYYFVFIDSQFVAVNTFSNLIENIQGIQWHLL